MQNNIAKTIEQKVSNDVSGAALPVMKIMVKPVEGKGRGVFCAYPIKKGEIVEYAPALPMPKTDIIPDSVMDSYVLMWRDDTPEECYCIVGGYVMFYNHSAEPNIAMSEETEAKAIKVTALRDIEAGEELLWNYGCEIWFDVK